MVSAAGPDQPGIVAEFTRVFVERECNLEDSSMTVLRGHFAMMLVVETPETYKAETLESDLTFATSNLGLIVNVWEISPLVDPASGGERWTVWLHGADRRGIVNSIAEVLAKDDANIVEVATRLEESGEYTMQLTVVVPPSTDAGQLSLDLAVAAKLLGIECSLQHDV